MSLMYSQKKLLSGIILSAEWSTADSVDDILWSYTKSHLLFRFLFIFIF